MLLLKQITSNLEVYLIYKYQWVAAMLVRKLCLLNLKKA